MRLRPSSVPPVRVVPDGLLPRAVAALRWHRRTIAVALAGLALLLALRAFAPAEPSAVVVFAAAHDVDAGHVLGAHDLTRIGVPPALVPSGAIRDGPEPAGRTVALPLRRGEIVTDVRLLGPPLLGALNATEPSRELVAAPVRLADPASASVVTAGDVVDVLAAGENRFATVAASAARVLTVGTDPDAALLVLAVTTDEALALARAAALDRLTVALR